MGALHRVVHALQPDSPIGSANIAKEFKVFALDHSWINLCPEQRFRQKPIHSTGLHQVLERTEVQVQARTKQKNRRSLQPPECRDFLGNLIGVEHVACWSGHAPFTEPAIERAAAIGFKIGNRAGPDQPHRVGRRDLAHRYLPRRGSAQAPALGQVQ
jgi:hypothetical protein